MMRLVKNVLPLLLTGLACGAALAADGGIAVWKHNAKGALSVTWDDNEPTQFTAAVPMMNRYNIRGTFFIITDTVASWDSIRSAAQHGHEIGSHSLSHPRFDDLDSQQIDYELRRSQIVIDSMVLTRKCVTHAYPWCQYENAESLARKYYIAARGCGAGMALDTGKNLEDVTPENLFNVQATHVDREGEEMTSAILNGYVDKLLTHGGWLVELHHGIDSVGYMWTYSDTLELHLKYIRSHIDSIYVAPFGEVSRYIIERNCATVTLQSESPTERKYVLSDTLADNNTYNQPLTVKVPLPSGWPFALAIQNGDTMWSSLAADTLLFDAVPDGGVVALSRSELAARTSPAPRPLSSVRFLGNPARIECNVEGASRLSVSIYNPAGAVVALPLRSDRIAGRTVVFLAQHLSASGVYIVRVRVDGRDLVRRVSYSR